MSNPYKSIIHPLGEYFTRDNPEEDDRIVAFADRLVEKGADLFTNEERRIEFIGIAAKILDWGVFAIVGGIEGTVLAEKIIKPLELSSYPVLKSFPSLLPILMTPAAGFFLGIAAVESFIEFLQMRRGILFLHSIEKRKEDPIEAMQWLKSRYFTLSKVEGEKIQAFIEKSAPQLSQREKAKRFDEIAEKALHVKYDSLKRRVSPGLAKEVSSQLSRIDRDLRSFSPARRGQAKERAQILVESLSSQAKIKILVHGIAMLALACTIISMSVFLSGIAAGPLFVIMGAIAVSLLLTSTILDKGVLAKEGEKLYDRLIGFTQRVEAHSTAPPLLQEAL